MCSEIARARGFAAVRAIAVALLLAAPAPACSGGGADLGESCERHGDCNATLQCAERVCIPRCERAPDCGDGFACGDDGLCTRAIRRAGERCTSEPECEAGLSCQLDGAVDRYGRVLSSCTAQTSAAPAGAGCERDDDCRNGTCSLGRCTDLCRTHRDCGAGTSCVEIPRLSSATEAPVGSFNGCLPSAGVVAWNVPVTRAEQNIYLPVPSTAQHASLIMQADPPSRVGAVRVTRPDGTLAYQACADPTSSACPVEEETAQYFRNAIRHRREVGISVLALSATGSSRLVPGAYRVRVSSLPGPFVSTPTVRALVRFGTASTLDLHFHFMDLAEHPCSESFGRAPLAARSAEVSEPFQVDFLGELRTILAGGGVRLGMLTYQDLREYPELDALEIARAGDLLSLGKRPTGINVFFVRNLIPTGVLVFGPSMGPPGVGGSRRSGIVIGLDALCYRSWNQVARLAAHEIGRYLGLAHNVEIDGQRDLLETGTSPSNLMHFSELGGTDLTGEQRGILVRSPVLR